MSKGIRWSLLRPSIANCDEKVKGLKKSEQARIVGKVLAERALSRGIREVVFDRGGFRYIGRVQALAEGAREGGLKF